MAEDIRIAGQQHVAAIQSINRDLVEKAFRMRSESYFAHVKSRLLMQTICEIDKSKKYIEEYNASLVRQRDIILNQQRELAAKTEELLRLNSELEQRVAQRTADLESANARLAVEIAAHQKARATAENMYRFKSTILANMSHEFRTPLSSIIGFADLLMRDIDENKRRPYAEKIKRNAVRLLGTLNDVLELAQLERGEVESVLQNVDLAAECRAVASELEPRAVSKGLAFDVKIEQEPSVVRSDPQIVRRILERVVANAIKFTGQGSVTLSVTRSGNLDFPIAVTIKDTGIGIAPELLPKLGTEFTQGSEGYAREFEGLGLGLALARRYVALLGARLDIQSTKDQGTTVMIAWPSPALP